MVIVEFQPSGLGQNQNLLSAQLDPAAQIFQNISHRWPFYSRLPLRSVFMVLVEYMLLALFERVILTSAYDGQE